jgi:hypothetical protein
MEGFSPKWEPDAPARRGIRAEPRPFGHSGKSRPFAVRVKPRPLPFVIELVFFDLPIERRQSDIEETGCLRLIATGVVEDALDM